MCKFIYISDNKEINSWKIRELGREPEISFSQISD